MGALSTHRGDNWLKISYSVLPSVFKLATSWRDCVGEYFASCLLLRVVVLRLSRPDFQQGRVRGVIIQ